MQYHAETSQSVPTEDKLPPNLTLHGGATIDLNSTPSGTMEYNHTPVTQPSLSIPSVSLPQEEAVITTPTTPEGGEGEICNVVAYKNVPSADNPNKCHLIIPSSLYKVCILST